MQDVIIAKAIAVPNKNTLSDKYSEFYLENIDLYLFFSEASYNIETASFSGVRLLHDRIIEEYNLS